MKKLVPLIFLFLLVTINVGSVFADDDEDDERLGFGEQDGEEREDDDRRIGFGTGVSDLILYVTITAIVGSIGYTGFRILRMKRPQIKSK